MLFRPCLPRLLFAATRHYRQAMLRWLESTIKDCPSHTRCKSSWGPFACSIVSFVALRVANMGASVKTHLRIGTFTCSGVIVWPDSPLGRKAAQIKMAATKAELNRYFEMINRRVPTRVSEFIRWLRKPTSFAARLAVALLLILGGIFSFLPVLGIWMLPLGLLLIAQDVPFLQKPLVSLLAWIEEKWALLRLKWQDR